MTQYKLSSLNDIITWLRPDLTFLNLAMSDYLSQRITDIQGGSAIRLQANKYAFLYCPAGFVYSSAVDVGSGYHHGIFPPSDDERRLCGCCLAVEGQNNQGEADCLLTCLRAPSLYSKPTPRSSVQSSRIFSNVCYDDKLFNETRGSTYEFSCLNTNIGSNSTCSNVSILNWNKNIYPTRYGGQYNSESSMTWTIVGIVLACAFVVAIVIIIGVTIYLKYRGNRAVTAYRSIGSESERLVQH